ncbi:MAG: hypothetical protein JNN25_15415 [Candidatus Kapabacteria bacterium]|nr:hypothetical protein [Candidatus Kapabacteria bacterium]
MSFADYVIPSAILGIAFSIYLIVYYRSAQSLKALGNNERRLLLFTKVSKN